MKLPAAQLRLLNLFLERPGELITRDEIAAHLWADTSTIDVANGINTSINRLRGNLSDPQNAGESIETVIGLGYRFVAEVVVEPPQEAEPPQARNTSQAQPEAVSGSSLEEDAAPAKITQMLATSPTPMLVLDRRWVALCVLLLIMVVGGMSYLRIGSAKPVVAAHPAVDPISQGFHLRPVTLTAPGETISALAVSPDGKAVAFSTRAGVSVHTFGGRDKLLPSRPFFQVSRIAWYPDGTQVLISGTDIQTHRHQVWSVFLWEGYQRLLVDEADRAVVSPSGNSVAYTRQNDSELWVADGAGTNARKLTADRRGGFSYLIWSPAGDRLLVDHHGASPAADEYESIDARSGAVLDHESEIAFTSGYLLQDGRLYFPLTETQNPASGKTRLMMVHTDRRTGKPLDQPQMQQSFAGYGKELSASLDGKRIALALDYATVNVFVADFREPGSMFENVKELPHELEESYPHAWTPDGLAVLSESSALGTWAIFKQPLSSTTSQLVAKLPGLSAMAQMSPDGRWIMFLRFPKAGAPPNGIFRVPVGGGEPMPVSTIGQIEDFRCSASGAGVCVVREAISHTGLAYFALDPLTGMGRELARTPWHPIVLGDWGLSPDGSTISVTDHDLIHPFIRLIRLGGGSAVAPTDIPLRGHGTLMGSSWAADARSLFVECRTREGFELVNLALGGKVALMRKSSVSMWAIPSRDGKKIAFPDRTSSNNVWASDVLQ